MNNDNIYIFEQKYYGQGAGDVTHFPSGKISNIKRNDIITLHAINIEDGQCSYVGIISIYTADNDGTLTIQKNNNSIMINSTIINTEIENWDGSFAVMAPKHSNLSDYTVRSENFNL